MKCDTLERQVKIKNRSPDEVEQLILQKQLHLIKTEIFYNTLKEKSVTADENPEMEVLSLDYQQNVPLPKVPFGDGTPGNFRFITLIFTRQNKEAHC